MAVSLSMLVCMHVWMYICMYALDACTHLCMYLSTYLFHVLGWQSSVNCVTCHARCYRGKRSRWFRTAFPFFCFFSVLLLDLFLLWSYHGEQLSVKKITGKGQIVFHSKAVLLLLLLLRPLLLLGSYNRQFRLECQKKPPQKGQAEFCIWTLRCLSGSPEPVIYSVRKLTRSSPKRIVV